MLSRIGYAMAVAAMATGLMGCQNKLAKERDELYVQNREQQAKIEAMQAAMEAQKSAPPAPVVNQAPAAPAPPAPTPPVTEASTPVTPAAPPRIEGAETTADPVRGTVTVNIQGDVLFDAGKADLRTASRRTLDQVASALNGQYKGKTVRVEGHSDSDPIKASKWKNNQ